MNDKQEIFLQHFNPLKNNLWKFCLSITDSSDNARDLLQDTIEIAYKSFDTLKCTGAFLSWLFTVAVRQNTKNRAKRGRLIFCDPSDFGRLISPDTSYERKADIEELYIALNKLKPEIKESVLLAEVFGFSQKEICEIQGITLSSLKQRLHRAKKFLRDELETGFNQIIESDDISPIAAAAIGTNGTT
jgi:RNA polymerase sigma factor (sigma-70 family)